MLKMVVSNSSVDPIDFEPLLIKKKEAFQSQDSRFRNTEGILRLAAIDIGTNSTHLVISSIDPRLNTFSIDLAEKSSTRLGNRNSETGELTDSSKLRVLETLRRFKELSSSHKVEEMLLAATSAVREAPNGTDFLKQIKDELDLDVELVSGTEEARLIYLGVLSGMSFGNRPHVLLDIGGGSTELILADDKDARALTSTRLGAVSLQRDFISHEPLSYQRLEFLRIFIQGSLEPAINKIFSRIKTKEKPVLVATSGTALAIGNLLASEEQGILLGMHGYKFSKERLDDLLETLLSMTVEQRRQLPSLSYRRADIIVPGALILQMAMEMLGVEEVVLSERALREGLVVDWMLRKGLLRDRFAFQGSIRKRTVLHQAERFSVDRKRSEKVADHALKIYDNTKGVLHHDDGEGRQLLWAAAMLYSCGQHINLASYHKHTWYLIRYSDLLGYSQAEHLIIAAIARYHRKSLPKKRHDAWQALLHKKDRKIASEMSLILRLSAALNRRPDSVISSLNISCNSDRVNMRLIPKDHTFNLELEKWSLNNCASIVKELTGVKLQVFVK